MAGYKRSTVMPLKRNEDKLKCQWGGEFAYLPEARHVKKVYN